MKNARETIYSALFAKLASVTDFKVLGRVPPSLNQVAPENCPALYMEQGPENATFSQGLPTIWRLNVTFFVFVHATDGNPQAILNDLKDKIENALNIDDIDRRDCTLGGLVQHCRLGGAPIEHWENLNEAEIAAMAVPVEILTT